LYFAAIKLQARRQHILFVVIAPIVLSLFFHNPKHNF
jgi:hypothetical protein